MTEKIINCIKNVRKEKPLVCCMTNSVVCEFTANALLACGALPVMSQAPEEAEEMVSASNALLLNIGTLTDSQFSAMLKAGRKAKSLGIPVIFDPVGAGATSYRLKSSLEIIKEIKPDIIKGNPGEIAALLGIKNNMKGVESIDTEKSPGDLCLMAGEKFRCVCAVTGKCDYVSCGNRVYELENGTELLNRCVGTGCTVGALCGACGSVEKDFSVAALAALTIMSVGGEIAEKHSGKRIGAFRQELLNAFEEEFDCNKLHIKEYIK